MRDTVEDILADIERRGDVAVRELSVKFDDWDRGDYRLSDTEITQCVDSLSAQDIKDIEFAQTQVRRFAEAQRVDPGRRNRDAARGRSRPHQYPCRRTGLLRARRQISAACVGAYVGHHREGGRRAACHHMCAPV